MKHTIVKILSSAAVLAGLVSCETYKVGNPEMSAVADFDGRWVCFAYPKATPAEPETVFMVDIFNTTFNDSDKFWMNIIDCSGGTYLDCLQLKASCDSQALTFGADDVDASQPRTCYNIWLEQGYYTAGYAGIVDADGYKVTVGDGKVTKEAVKTAGNLKADAIEFSYKRTGPDGTVSEYFVKGMKNTGWAEDLKEYIDFLESL